MEQVYKYLLMGGIPEEAETYVEEENFLKQKRSCGRMDSYGK